MIYVQTSLSTLFYSQWPSNHRRQWSQFISSLFSPCCWISESVFTPSSPQTILSSCINQVQSLFTQSGFFSSLWRGHVVLLRWGGEEKKESVKKPEVLKFNSTSPRSFSPGCLHCLNECGATDWHSTVVNQLLKEFSGAFTSPHVIFSS